MRPVPALLGALFSAVALSPTAQAQDQVACTIMGCATVHIERPAFAAADSFSVQEVWSVVNDILSVSGLAPNFQVVETQEVGNAAAVIIDDERYLAFNPVWMNRYKDDPNARWQLYGVMAHEVGHHLQGHTLTGLGSRPPTELEADEYAGFTLAALGASLGEAQSLWATLGERGSATHPPRAQRLDAVERGWGRYRNRAGALPAALPKAAPRPALAGESCRSRSDLGARVCSSSTLAPQGSNSYSHDNLFDGNPRTAWVEGIAGTGEGSYVSFSFDSPRTLSRLRLINGYAKSEKAYRDNARVSSLRVISSGGANQSVRLRDTSAWQEIDLRDLGPVSWVMFRIDSTYSGARWADTAISEFDLR